MSEEEKKTKEEMLDYVCDPEPLSGYTLLDEIEFTLYSAQSASNGQDSRTQHTAKQRTPQEQSSPPKFWKGTCNIAYYGFSITAEINSWKLNPATAFTMARRVTLRP